MEDLTNYIISHENFGRAIGSNPQFRKVFQTNAVGAMASHLLTKFEFDKNGNLIDKLGDVHPRLPDEDYPAYLRRLTVEIKTGFTARKTYGSLAENYFEGGQTNLVIRELASRHGLQAQITTFNTKLDMPTAEAREALTSIIRYDEHGEMLGHLRPSDDSMSYLEMFDPKTKQRVNMSRINEVLGAQMSSDSRVFKRFNMFLNDRQIERVADPGEEIKILTYDPQAVFSADPAARKAARMAVATGDFKTLKEAYDAMSDGWSQTLTHEIQRNIDFMTSHRNQFAAELATIKEGSQEYISKQRNINMLTAQIDRMRKGLAAYGPEGDPADKFLGGFMTRTFGAVDPMDIDEATGKPRIYHQLKGDVGITSDEAAIRFLRLDPKYQHFTDNQMKELVSGSSFIAPRANEVTQMMATGEVASVRMFHQPAGHGAYSNSLAMTTMGELLDPNTPEGGSHLLHGLKTTVQDEVNAIAQGHVTPGLYQMIEELEQEQLADDLHPLEREAKLRGKAFAVRLKSFLRGGGDFRTNPYMAQQAMKTIRDHHFRIEREDDGIIKKIMFQGREVDDLTMRMPIPFTVAAHRTPVRGIRAGTASFDDDSARMLINPGHALSARLAEGGSDYDDLVNYQLRYDPKTRRALYFGLRDPNALGEYMYYDADIKTDRFLPIQIKQMAGERDQLLISLKDGANKANKARDIRRVDAINTILHRYFTGQEVTVHGVRLGEGLTTLKQSTIPNVDLMTQYAEDAHRFIAAPIGFRVTPTSRRRYSTPDVSRGFITSKQMGGKDEFLSNLVASSSPNAEGSLFRFVGKSRGEYADFMEMGLFRRHEGVEAAIEASKQTSVGKLTTQDVLKRLDSELEARGMLGRFVNPMGVIENMLHKYANIDNYGNVDQVKAAQFQERFLQEFRNAGIYRVGREDIIDAMTKSGGADLINMVPEMLKENDVSIGRLIKTMQGVAKDMKFDVGFGIDPIVFEQRGKGMRAGLLAGYGEKAIGKTLLGAEDQMSSMSRLFDQTMEYRRELTEEIIPSKTKEMAANLLDQFEAMDFRPTVQETTRAQEYLSYYADNMNEIREANKNSDFMLSKLFEGLEQNDIDNVLAPYAEDAAQIKSLLKLEQWGLLDPDKLNDLDRQLLAVAHVAAQSMTDTEGKISAFDAFGSLMRGTTVEGVPNITELYQGALVRQSGLEDQIMDQIYNIGPDDGRAFSQLYKDFFRYYGDTDTGHYYSVGHALNPHLNQQRLSIALADQAEFFMQQSYERADAAAQPKFARIHRTNASRYRDMMEHADRQATEMLRDIKPNTALPPGLGRYFARTNADETAEAVSAGRIVSDEFNAMKRLDRKAISDLMAIRGVRGGAIGLGIFAGIGLLYGATKDRSFEDMQGPPLLPGGSAYEQYSQVPPDMSSIYSSTRGTSFGPGVLYKVNINGSFDSDQVRDRIQSITGSPVDTRVYKSRQTTSRDMNTQDIMKDLIG